MRSEPGSPTGALHSSAPDRPDDQVRAVDTRQADWSAPGPHKRRELIQAKVAASDRPSTARIFQIENGCLSPMTIWTGRSLRWGPRVARPDQPR